MSRSPEPLPVHAALRRGLVPEQRGESCAVRADDLLIEALRTGRVRPDDPDPLARLLHAWRRQVRYRAT